MLTIDVLIEQIVTVYGRDSDLQSDPGFLKFYEELLLLTSIPEEIELTQLEAALPSKRVKLEKLRKTPGVDLAVVAALDGEIKVDRARVVVLMTSIASSPAPAERVRRLDCQQLEQAWNNAKALGIALSDSMKRIGISIRYCHALQQDEHPFVGMHNLETLELAIGLGFDYQDPQLIFLAAERVNQLCQGEGIQLAHEETERLKRGIQKNASKYKHYALLWNTQHQKFCQLLIHFADVIGCPVEEGLAQVSAAGARSPREYLFELIEQLPLEALLALGGDGGQNDGLFHKLRQSHEHIVFHIMRELLTRCQRDLTKISKIQDFFRVPEFIMFLFDRAFEAQDHGELAFSICQSLFELLMRGSVQFLELGWDRNARIDFISTMIKFSYRFGSVARRLPQSEMSEKFASYPYVMDLIESLSRDELLPFIDQPCLLLNLLGERKLPGLEITFLVLQELLTRWQASTDSATISKIGFLFESDGLIQELFLRALAAPQDFIFDFFRQLFGQVASQNQHITLAYTEWLRREDSRCLSMPTEILLNEPVVGAASVKKIIESRLKLFWVFVHCKGMFQHHERVHQVARRLLSILSHSVYMELARANLLAVLQLPCCSGEELPKLLMAEPVGKDQGFLWLLILNSIKSREGSSEYYQFLSLLFASLPLQACQEILFPKLGLTARSLSENKGLVSLLNLSFDDPICGPYCIAVFNAFLRRKEFSSIFSTLDSENIRIKLWFGTIDLLTRLMRLIVRSAALEEQSETLAKKLGDLLQAFSLPWHNNFFFKYLYRISELPPIQESVNNLSPSLMSPSRHLILLLENAKHLGGGALNLAQWIERDVYVESSDLIVSIFYELDDLSRQEPRLYEQTAQSFASGLGLHYSLLLPALQRFFGFEPDPLVRIQDKLQNLSLFLWCFFSGRIARDRIEQQGRMKLIIPHFRALKSAFEEAFDVRTSADPIILALSELFSQVPSGNLIHNQSDVEQLLILDNLYDMDFFLTDATPWSQGVSTSAYQTNRLYEKARNQMRGASSSSFQVILLHSRDQARSCYHMFEVCLILFGHECNSLDRDALKFLWEQLTPSNKMDLWGLALDLFQDAGASYEYYLGERGLMAPIYAPGQELTWVDHYFLGINDAGGNGDPEPLAALLGFVQRTLDAMEQGRGKNLLDILKQMMSYSNTFLQVSSRTIGLCNNGDATLEFLFKRSIGSIELFTSLQGLQIVPLSKERDEIFRISALPEYFNRFNMSFKVPERAEFLILENWAHLFQNSLINFLSLQRKLAQYATAIDRVVYLKLISKLKEIFEREGENGVTLFHYLLGNSSACASAVALTLLEYAPDLKIRPELPQGLQPEPRERLLWWMMRKFSNYNRNLKQNNIIFSSYIAQEEISYLLLEEQSESLKILFNSMYGSSLAALVMRFPEVVFEQKICEQFLAEKLKWSPTKCYEVLYDFVANILELPLFSGQDELHKMKFAQILGGLLVNFVSNMKAKQQEGLIVFDLNRPVNDRLIGGTAMKNPSVLLTLLFQSDFKLYPHVFSKILSEFFEGLDPALRKKIWERASVIPFDRGHQTIVCYLLDLMGSINLSCEFSPQQSVVAKILFAAIAQGASVQLSERNRNIVEQCLIRLVRDSKPQNSKRHLSSERSDFQAFEDFYQTCFNELYQESLRLNLQTIFRLTVSPSDRSRLIATMANCLKSKPVFSSSLLEKEEDLLKREMELFVTASPSAHSDESFRGFLVRVYKHCQKTPKLAGKLKIACFKMFPHLPLFDSHAERYPEIAHFFMALRISLLDQGGLVGGEELPRFAATGESPVAPARDDSSLGDSLHSTPPLELQLASAVPGAVRLCQSPELSSPQRISLAFGASALSLPNAVHFSAMQDECVSSD